MKYKFILCSLISIFILIAFYLLAGNIRPQAENVNLDDTNDNNAEYLAYEKEMLADPETGEIPEGISYKNAAFLRDLQNKEKLQYRKTRGDHWRSRGPWNVGGRTRAMAIDVSNEKHLIAGAVSGGIWQSFDGGISWARVGDINGHPGVVSISQDVRPGKTHIWYALSGEIYGTSASGGGNNDFYLGDGAYRSMDNGYTWKSLSNTSSGKPSSFTTPMQGGWRIATDPVDSLPAWVFMATYGTIYRSKDTGNTWSTALNNGSCYFTDVKISSKGVLYVSMSTEDGGVKGFFRSANGTNFKNITPSFIKAADRTVIEINPNNEDEVYFLSEVPTDSSGGVATANFEGNVEYVALSRYRYLSGDGTGAGGEWANLSGNLPVIASSPFDRFNTQGGYDLFVRMQPGSNTLFIGGTNIYRSTDAFNTKNNISQIGGYGVGTTQPYFTVYLNHHPDQHDLLFLKSDPKKAYSISDGGIRYTENINAPIVEWQNRNYGYVTSQLYTVAIDENTKFDPWLLAGLQDNGNHISNNISTTHSWVLPFNGDGAYNYIAPDHTYCVMSIQQGRIAKMVLDKHGYLVARRRIDPDGYEKSDYSFINPFVVDPNNNNLLYLPIGKKILRLNNLNSIAVNNDYSQLKTGWDVLTDTIKTLNPSTTSNAKISTLAISKNAANILYLGTNNGEMYRIDNANTGNPKMILLDTSVTKKLPAGGYVSGIAIDPDSAKNVLICYSNYSITSLYYSRDSGANWFYVGGNLEQGNANPTGADPSIRCVNILRGQNGKRIYFAGTSIGLFSTDSLVLSSSKDTLSNTTFWKQESPDKIGAAVVVDIRVRQSDGYVAIATHGNGAFESYYNGPTPPEIIAPDVEVNLYPNPASDKIYFSYDATGLTNNVAAIYDMQGRRINSFQNGMTYNNTFTQVVDVSNYPNGHYLFCFYSSDRKIAVKHFNVQH